MSVRPPRATRSARLTLLAAALSALLAAGPGSARAQEFERTPYQVADHAAAHQRVTEFRRHADRGNWHLAVTELQRMLDLDPALGLVVRVTGSRPARYEGAHAVAVRLFESLPPEGVEAWEAVSRGRAEELLGRGLRLRRPNDLREAARRFPARDIRRRAYDALARFAFARGDFVEAGHVLELLLELGERDERPALFARLAFARAQSADREGVDRTVPLAADLLDREVPGPAGPEPLRDFLERMQRTAGPLSPAVAGRAQFPGDIHGLGQSEPPPAPPPAARWSAETNFERGQENESPTLFPRRDESAHPVVPAISGGIVYVNSGLSVTALNLATGTPLWRFSSPQFVADWRDNPVQVNTATVAGGVVYAALATRADAPRMNRRFYNRTIVYPLPHRSLYAFDAQTGEVLWSHESAALRDRADAAEIDRESVASPPLVVGDDVYVATWSYQSSYDVRLVCFDRRTGATRWRTKLVRGQQELNLFGRPVKELVTTPLAELDGRIYLGTGLGIVASVERATGEIDWLAAYEQTEIPATYYWYETKDRPVTWRVSPVAATRLAVLVAPTDAEALYAFDPRTGEPRWRPIPQNPRPSRFHWFLGVLDGRAYVLGSRLACFDTATGRELWTGEAGRLATQRIDHGPATGAGLLTQDAVYVPTERAILALDPRTGATSQAWPLPEAARDEEPVVSGTLVSGDGALLVLTADTVSAHYHFEALRDRLLARMATHPRDARLRLEAGEVFRSAGRTDDAIASFRRGLELLDGLSPRARDRIEAPLRRALHDAHLQRGEARRSAGDFTGALADLREAVSAARERGDAARALFVLAETAASCGQWGEAEKALERAREEHSELVAVLPGAGRVHVGALALVRLGELASRQGRSEQAVEHWLDALERHAEADLGRTDVRGRVHDLLAAMATARGDLVSKAVRERARRAFEAARKSGSAAALDRVARLYPDPQVAGDAALLAAQMHIEAGRAADAVSVLRTLSSGTRATDQVSARALRLLARAYRALGETVKERLVLRRLREDFGGVEVEPGLLARELAARELGEERFAAPSATLPDPRPPLVLRWETGEGEDSPPQVVGVRGTWPDAMAGHVPLVRGQVLELADGETGRPLWRRPLTLEHRSAFGTRDVLALVGESLRGRVRTVAMTGIDPRTGEELWSSELTGRYQEAATSLGVLYLLHSDTSRTNEKVYTLSAIALDTGETVAQRELEGQIQPALTAAEDALVVYDSTRRRGAPVRTAMVLDAATLGLRGTVPLEHYSSHVSLHVPLTSVVVTTDGNDTLVAIDVATGRLAWPRLRLPGRAVKQVRAVPEGIVVSDDGDQLRRLDPATGAEVWRRPLGDALAGLGYNGEAAEGDLVVATLLPRDASSDRGTGRTATAVGLDAATGEERWRTPIEIRGSAYPDPEVFARVVAYEVNDKLEAEYSARVVLLDRETGRRLQDLEHPRIGRTYQEVGFLGGLVALGSGSELAVYGPPR